MQGDRNKPVVSARPESGAPTEYDVPGTYLERNHKGVVQDLGALGGSEQTRDPEARHRAKVRQVALVALMIVAASLILVLPESDDESYALDSQANEASLLLFDAGNAPPALQRYSAPRSGNENDELALPAGEDSDDDAGPAAESMSAALAAEALAALAEETMLVNAVRPTTTTTTTTASTTTAPKPPPSTAGLEEATSPDTTEAVAPPSSADETSAQDADAETSDTAADGAAEDGSAAAAESSEGENAPSDATQEATDTSVTETSEPETTPETTVVEGAPETTLPPETAPPSTEPPAPNEGTWVDTGNGVLVPKELIAIRYCESRDNYVAKNPSSSARGAYQFLTGSWAAYGHKDRYGVTQAHLASPAQQDEAALLTWQRDGTRPWNASKSCWSKRL